MQPFTQEKVTLMSYPKKNIQNIRSYILSYPSNKILLLKTNTEREKVDSLDDSILHIDVGIEGLVIVDDLSPFDQETVTL